VSDWKNGDPQGSESTKSLSQRKGRYDSGWTPTETVIRNGLMRQFMKNPEGTTNSAAYREAECWCACGRLRAENSDKCARCA
jgi:hypothetical protein